jgi:hypothetical protein
VDAGCKSLISICFLKIAGAPIGSLKFLGSTEESMACAQYHDLRVDVGCKSLISICFSKIAGAPIGSLKFLGSKEESMACALRRDGVADSGNSYGTSVPSSWVRTGGQYLCHL